MRIKWCLLVCSRGLKCTFQSQCRYTRCSPGVYMYVRFLLYMRFRMVRVVLPLACGIGLWMSRYTGVRAILNNYTSFSTCTQYVKFSSVLYLRAKFSRCTKFQICVSVVPVYCICNILLRMYLNVENTGPTFICMYRYVNTGTRVPRLCTYSCIYMYIHIHVVSVYECGTGTTYIHIQVPYM